MQVEFMFTDDTILSLSKTLAAFPVRLKEKEMPIIRLGRTVDNVSLQNLENLLRVCKDRVIIDLKDTDLKSIYMKSKYAKLLETVNASELTEENRRYLFDLQK